MTAEMLGADAPDFASQRTLLWASVPFYAVTGLLLAWAIFVWHARSDILLRVSSRLGPEKAASVHTMLGLGLVSIILRVSWMILLAEDAWGKLTGPSCYSGTVCAGQIFHTALNRIGQMLYFVVVCRLGAFMGARYAPPAVRDAGITSTRAVYWQPPALQWDLTLMASDFSLVVLQVLILVISVALPVPSAQVVPVYDAYQYQLSLLFALAGVWFAVFALATLRRSVCGVDDGSSNSSSSWASWLCWCCCCRRRGKGTTGPSGVGEGSDTRAAAERTPLIAAELSSSASSVNNSTSPGALKQKRRKALTPRDSEAVRSLTSTLSGALHSRGSGSGQRCASYCCVCSPRGVAAWAVSSWPAWSTGTAALLISALFFLRVFLFLYTPITGAQLSGSASSAMYPTFFYTAPEVLPLLLLIDTIMPGGLAGARRWYQRAGSSNAY